MVMTTIECTPWTYVPRAILSVQPIQLLKLNIMVRTLVLPCPSIEPHDHFMANAVVTYLPTPYETVEGIHDTIRERSPPRDILSNPSPQ
jgi:hypothetical protein